MLLVVSTHAFGVDGLHAVDAACRPALTDVDQAFWTALNMHLMFSVPDWSNIKKVNQTQATFDYSPFLTYRLYNLLSSSTLSF